MTDIAFPTTIIKPREFELRLVSNTQIFTNPLIGSIRTRAVPGYRWRGRLTWGDLYPPDSAKVESFLTTLRGQENRLMLWNIMRPDIYGLGGGSPLVNGANQTGDLIVIDGAAHSITNWVLPGDMIGFDDILVMVKTAANTDGSGNVTVHFEPPMWKSPADNAPVALSMPKGRFVNISNEVSWRGTDTKISDHSLEVVETLSE